MATDNKKSTSKELFQHYETKLLGDDRYKNLDDNRKREVLNQFYDNRGVKYLNSMGLNDPDKISSIKNRWVEETFQKTSLKKKEETEVPKEEAIPDFGKDFLPEFVQKQDVARVEPELDITKQEDLSAEQFEGVKLVNEASDLQKKVDEAKEWYESEETQALPKEELDKLAKEKYDDLTKQKKDLVERQAKYLEKYPKDKSIEELQSDLTSVNQELTSFSKEKAQSYNPILFDQINSQLDAQYQQDIQSGLSEEQAEMNRGLNMANLESQYPQEFSNVELQLNREYPSLKATKNLTTKANELNSIYKDIQDNNGWENLKQGTKDGLVNYFKDFDSFLGGFQTEKSITALADKLDKINNGEDLKLTEDEQMLLKSLVVTSDLTNKINKELPSGYKIGTGVGGSLGFMAEFGLTGGLGAGVKASAVKGATKLTEKTTKAAVKKTIKMSGNLAGTLAQAGIQTSAMPTFYKDMAKNKAEGQDFGEAFFNSYYDTFTEALSERIFMGTIGGSSSGLQSMINKLGVRTAGSPANVLRATGEEYLEEKFAEAMHGAKDAESFTEFAGEFFDAKSNLETLATTAIISGTMSVPSMGGYALNKYDQIKFDNKYNAVSNAVPNDLKSEIDNILSNEDLTIEQANELVGDAVKNNVKSGNISEEQGKEAVVNAEQYFLLSLQKKAQEGKLVEKPKEEKPEAEDTAPPKAEEKPKEEAKPTEEVKEPETKPTEVKEETDKKINEAKAEIEKIRKEELDAIPETIKEEAGDALKSKEEEINAKYDAELKKLEDEKAPEGKEVSEPVQPEPTKKEKPTEEKEVQEEVEKTTEEAISDLKLPYDSVKDRLIKEASKRLGFKAKDIQEIDALSKKIAKADNSKEVKNEHLAEAIQYKTTTKQETEESLQSEFDHLNNYDNKKKDKTYGGKTQREYYADQLDVKIDRMKEIGVLDKTFQLQDTTKPEVKKETPSGKAKVKEPKRKFSKQEKEMVDLAVDKIKVDEKRIKAIAEAIDKKEGKEDIAHVAEAIQYAQSEKELDNLFADKPDALRAIAKDKVDSHPQAGRILELNLPTKELNKVAKKRNDMFMNIHSKTRDLDNDARTLLGAGIDKMDLTLSQVNDIVNNLEGNTPTDVSKAILSVTEEKPSEPTPQEEKKTEQVVEDKLEQQEKVKTEAEAKEQKKRLLQDLNDIQDILMDAETKALLKEKEEAGATKSEISDFLSRIYDLRKLDELSEEQISELKQKGFEVNKDGTISIDVYKDGTVKVGDVLTARELVEKKFPSTYKSKQPGKTLKGGPRKPSTKEKDLVKKAYSYGSVEQANKALEMAENNLSEAKKSGNKGLINVMQEQYDYEKSVNEQAQRIDYEKSKAIEKEIEDINKKLKAAREKKQWEKYEELSNKLAEVESESILFKKDAPQDLGSDIGAKEEVLSEKDFFKKYEAIHKDIRSKTKEDKEKTSESIKKEGFSQGTLNILPMYKGMEKATDVVSKKYGVKKGDKVYILPKEGVDKNKTKKGYKPKDYEIIDIEYDNQPIYEAYLNKIKEKPTEPKAPQDLKSDVRAGKGKEVEVEQLKETDFQEVPKLRDILTRLANNIGKTLKYSKMGKRTAGFYRPSVSLLAIKKANDLETVAHEVGHYFDDKHKLLDDVSSSLNRELSEYWEGGSKPPKGISEEEADKYRQQEGFAEWLRVFVLNPTEAKKSKGIYDLYMTKVDKKDRDAIDTFSNEIRSLLSQTRLSGISSIVHTDNPEKRTLAQKIFPKYLLEPFKSKAAFTTAFLNQFFNSEEGFRKAMRVKGIEKVLPSEDFNMLSRLTLGHDDVFYNIMEKGMVDSKMNRLKDEKTGEPMTKRWLFEPAKGKDFKQDVEINRNRMIAERTVEFIDNMTKRQILEDLKKDILPPDSTLDKYPELKEEVVDQTTDEKTGESKNVTAEEKVKQLKKDKVDPQKEARYDFTHLDVSGISLGVKTKGRNDYNVAKEALSEYNAYIKAHPEKKEVYDELKRRYQAFADANLKYAVDKGRLSKEQYNLIKEMNAEYIALSRVKQTEIGADIFEDTFFASRGKKQVGTPQEIMHRFKGSTKDIIDPYVALLNSTYSMVKESNRNEAMQAFTKVLRGERGMREGDIMELAEIGYKTDSPSDPYTITVYNKGEKEYWRFSPDVYESLKGMDDISHQLPLILTLYAKILRPSVTTFPVFQIRNRIRDFQNRLVVSSHLPSLRDYRNKKKGFDDYELFGGGQFGYHLRSKGSYYSLVEKAMKEANAEGNVLIANPRNLGKLYQKILGDSEKKTRIEEFYNVYDEYKKKGYSDYDAKIAATYEARDLLDFKVAGKSIRALNSILPFTNAKIQGFRRLAKAIQRNPVRFTFKFVLFALLPQLANTLLIAESDDEEVKEEYKNLPNYRRDLFYNIPIKDLGLGKIHWLIIPKPFEVGLMASTMGRLVDAVMLDDKLDEQFDSEYVEFITKGLLPIDYTGIVTNQGPVKSLLSNYDSFRERSIVPEWEKDLAVPLRDTEGSSRLGKLGQKLTMDQADPRQVDFFIKSMFSYYGDLSIRLSNIGDEEARDKMNISLTGLLKETYDSPYASRDIKWVLETMKEYSLRKDDDYREFEKGLRHYRTLKSEEEKKQHKKALEDYSAQIKEKWERKEREEGLIEYSKKLRNKQ